MVSTSMVWAAVHMTYPADNPYMDMECLITLDDAVAALHAQLNAPSRRFAALISSWFHEGEIRTVHACIL